MTGEQYSSEEARFLARAFQAGPPAGRWDLWIKGLLKKTDMDESFRALMRSVLDYTAGNWRAKKR